jgi:hypothetical protein
MSRLDEIEARLRAATPGPWRYVGGTRNLTAVVAGDHADEGEFDLEVNVCSLNAADDAVFIANAPEDIRDLLALVAELKSEAGR